MKLVTWNCNGAFRKKFHELVQLQADIYVVQECENPEQTNGEYRAWAKNYLWTGEGHCRGLGIFASSSIEIRRLDWLDNGLQLFLPVTVSNSFNLVGTWTKHANSPSFRYIGQLAKYLDLYKQKMATNHTVICGDLNSNKIWDLHHDTRWNHSAVVRELNAINMVSLYHAVTGEEQGEESSPTFYLHRNLQKPYHIDYAFSSKDLFNTQKNMIAIGNYEQWLRLSDHVPLTFTISK